MWGPTITAATVSPATVEVQGAYLVTVVVEDRQLTIAEAETLTLTQINTVPIEYMTERS